MKVTMNIDDALLKRVMRESGIKSKTRVVDLALREMDRRTTLYRLLSNNLGHTDEELRNAIDPNYDLMATRVAGIPASHGRRTRAHR